MRKKALNWLKEMLGLKALKPAHPQSIIERLEGLVPPVHLIEKSYNVDREVAEASHTLMLAAETLMVISLKKQQKAIEASQLLLDQQEVTANIIEDQVYKAADAQTIINNFRIFLTEDEATIAWILKHIIAPSIFAGGFGKQDAKRQRELFNALQKTVNDLQRTDSGLLVEPG
jgi:hypothetical protein